MYVAALTGGIGAGKSTVSRMLAERGAAVVDADVLARRAVEPGTDGYREVVEAFGPGVVAPDGTIDRGAVARLVFADEAARRRLERIVHPRVAAGIAERLQELAGTGAVVVLEIPLLVESRSGTASMAQAVIVVAASRQTQIERLAGRGLSLQEAEARIAAQAPLEEKLAVADLVIWNDGSLENLEARVDQVWAELRRRAAA